MITFGMSNRSTRCVLAFIAFVHFLISCKTTPNVVDTSHASAVEEGRKMKVLERSTAGILEPSGLASWTTPKQNKQIYVVGDRTFDIGIGRYVDSDKDIKFEQIDTKSVLKSAKIKTEKESQWEAIGVDGIGNVFVMQEHPTTLYVFSPQLNRALATISFNVKKKAEIYKDWNKDENSQGESFILLRNSHVLLLKEKSPLLLVEFGPPGGQAYGFSEKTRLGPGEAFRIPIMGIDLVPLHTWEPTNTAEKNVQDLSELALDESGRLYALSDKSESIVSINGATDKEIQTGSLFPETKNFRVNKVWKLPGELPKPEGLTFVEGDRPIVALDSCKPEDNCVFTLNRLKDL